MKLTAFACCCWRGHEWGMFSKYGAMVGLDIVKGRAINWAAVAKVIKGNGDRAY